MAEINKSPHGARPNFSATRIQRADLKTRTRQADQALAENNAARAAEKAKAALSRAEALPELSREDHAALARTWRARAARTMGATRERYSAYARHHEAAAAANANGGGDDSR